MDNTLRNTIRDRIAADLVNGVIQKLTFKIAKEYGLSNDNDTRLVQRQLKAKGYLVQRGNQFHVNQTKLAA